MAEATGLLHTARLLACDFPEIDRRLTKKEYGRVVDHLFRLGLDEGYVQELSSADERYVPAFDLTGV
jgi:putative pyruvate formate lyase activating enzyme